MSQPVVSPESSRSYTPQVRSLLNPSRLRDAGPPGRAGPAARLPQDKPAKVSLSPTQRLLRKKAAAAWRAEVMRQALAAIPAPKPPENFLAAVDPVDPVDPDEMACQVHILISDPMELEGGDIGLTIEEFSTLSTLSTLQEIAVEPSCPSGGPPLVPLRPLSLAPMIEKTPLNPRKGLDFDYQLVTNSPLKSPDVETFPARHRMSIITRRALPVVALFCIIVLIHALNMALDLSWRSPESP